MSEAMALNIEKAATIVCRNPDHLSQARVLLSESTSVTDTVMDVESLVKHWWDNQLFLGIKLN